MLISKIFYIDPTVNYESEEDKIYQEIMIFQNFYVYNELFTLKKKTNQEK